MSTDRRYSSLGSPALHNGAGGSCIELPPETFDGYEEGTGLRQGETR